MLPGLKDIFDMDPLLRRSFLLLCPVEVYGDLLKTECFSCLELCVTLRKLLPETKTRTSYTPSFVSTSRMAEANSSFLSVLYVSQFFQGNLKLK
jgi:hypothetical protein